MGGARGKFYCQMLCIDLRLGIRWAICFFAQRQLDSTAFNHDNVPIKTAPDPRQRQRAYNTQRGKMIYG